MPNDNAELSGDDRWMYGPNPEGEIEVRISAAIQRVANVDPVAGTAYVKFELFLAWVDERLKDWGNRPLPDNLWAPLPRLDIAMNDMDMKQLLIVVEKGRRVIRPADWFREGKTVVLRQLVFDGTIANPMTLAGFPFDCDDVEITFGNWSNWASADLSRSGQEDGLQNYRLAHLNPEGKLFLCTSNLAEPGSIPDWEFVSTTNFCNNTTFGIRVFIRRHSEYYVTKVLIPLWILGFIGLTTLLFDLDDFSDRMSNVSGMVLTTFALLYVVGESIPKTPFLTSIDGQIMVGILILLLVAVESCAVQFLLTYSEDLARTFNAISLVILGLVLSVSMSYMFFHARRQGKQARDEWHEQQVEQGLPIQTGEDSWLDIFPQEDEITPKRQEKKPTKSSKVSSSLLKEETNSYGAVGKEHLELAAGNERLDLA